MRSHVHATEEDDLGEASPFVPARPHPLDSALSHRPLVADLSTFGRLQIRRHVEEFCHEARARARAWARETSPGGVALKS